MHRKINKEDFNPVLKKYGPWLYLLMFSIFISLLSRQNIFSSATPNVDSSVFMTIAKGMTSGKVPYRDFFDHKGPFLYLLNYIGYSCGGIHGVWFIEVIAIVVAVFFTYTTVKSLFGRFIALCSTTTGFLFLDSCLQGGNLTEEYALPLICIAIYISVLSVQSNNLYSWQVIILGFTFGLSLMLRPNMFAVWFVISAYWVIRRVLNKEFIDALKYVLFFALGTFVSILPFIIYLWSNQAITDYVFQNFIFNSQYATYNGIKNIILNILNVTYSTSSAILLSLISCIIGFFITKTNRVLYSILFASLVLSILLVSVSQANYGHYYMVFAPLMPASFGVLFSLFKTIIMKNTISNKLTNLIVCAVALFVMSYMMLKSVDHIIDILKEKSDSQIVAVVECINNSANENDDLQVVGNECSIYLLSDLEPASKFIYDYPIAMISSQVHEQFVEEWNKSSPTYIVTENLHFDSEIEHIAWIEDELEEKYEIIFDTECYSVYHKRS